MAFRLDKMSILSVAPPNPGRDSSHQTQPPLQSGSPRPIVARAIHSAVIGEGQVPYPATLRGVTRRKVCIGFASVHAAWGVDPIEGSRGGTVVARRLSVVVAAAALLAVAVPAHAGTSLIGSAPPLAAGEQGAPTTLPLTRPAWYTPRLHRRTTHRMPDLPTGRDPRALRRAISAAAHAHRRQASHE